MATLKSNFKLRTRQCLDHSPFNDEFVVIFWHTHLRTFATYSKVLTVRRLRRRIAFFSSIRRCSLLETNQRLRRTVLKTPLLTTFLRKRLSRESCDSPFRKFTLANEIHLLPHGRSDKKSADVQTRPKIITQQEKITNDRRSIRTLHTPVL